MPLFGSTLIGATKSRGSGLFVAGGNGTTTGQTSPDGITWTSRTLPDHGFTAGGLHQFAFNGKVIVMLALTGGTGCYTSVDGINWSAFIAMPAAGGSEYSSITWNGTVFCAIAANVAHSATSPDGVTWTGGTLPSASNWQDVSWNGSVFSCIVLNGTTAATSTDGLTWTARTCQNGIWEALAWNGTVFCAVQNSTATAQTSPDGITWTSRTMPSNGDGYQALAWNGTVFAATASNPDSAFATSPDGVTWTARTIPTLENWTNLAWNGTVFCCLDSSNAGKALTSPDGITWTTRTTANTNSYSNIGVMYY